MIIQTVTHSSKLFATDAQSKTISAEASTLTAGLRDYPLFGRVYDDACDEGFSILSERTGRVVTWALDHEERDGEGDTLYWDLKPARIDELRAGLQGWRVRVYND